MRDNALIYHHCGVLKLRFGFGGVFGDFVRIWCGFHSFGLPFSLWIL